MEKSNVVPRIKRVISKCQETNGPVSLLPICGKIFERLLYNNMFEFFIKDSLISANQSGFKQGDSCKYQLLSITYEIYQSFDNVLK